MKNSIIAIFTVLVLITSLMTVYLCFEFGLKTGLFIGAIIFIMLGGSEILWFLGTHKSHEKNIRENNKKEKASFLKKSENNPTLR